MKFTQFLLAPLALASVCMLSQPADGQESSQKADSSTSQVTAQTGDGLLTLQANMPRQARIGEEFSYTVKVTNSSDNMTLHDIVLKQRKTDGFTVESVATQKASPKATDSKNKGQAGQQNESTKDAANSQPDQSNGDGKAGDGKNAAKEQQTKEAATKSDNQAKGNNKQIKIDTLKPGESQTFTVKATADKEGDLQSCLEISKYTPALCLATKVVKPELELTKTAPKNADRCKVIEIVYVLKNGGNGDVGAIQITDDLGDGLELINGDDSLQFDVDSLAAGDTRKFVATAFATKPGSYSSRATAKAVDSDLQSRSQSTTTEVSAAELAVKLTGPKQVYGDKPAKFTAMVMNTGNTDAADVTVTVSWPEQAKVADISDVSMMKTTEQPEKKADNQQPTPAKDDQQAAATKQDQKSSGTDKTKAADAEAAAPDAKMAQKEFKIESLAAGQTAQFEYTIRPGELTEVPTKVDAVYLCDVDAAKEQEQAESKVLATALARFKVVRLPALQIMIVDDEDPVSIGDDVTYNTRVWNEGDADDSNVQLKLMIPDGLEFVSAKGPTKFKQDGPRVVFEPLKTMKAGQREDFKLVAKAKGSGSVKLKAELSSKTLDSPVISEEPTELFDENATK